MAFDGQTLLVIQGMGVPLWSARGLTQTLTHIPQAAAIRRSTSGAPMDLSAEQFRKYASKITCSGEMNVLPFDGWWPGMEVVVDCVAELAYPLYSAPTRTVVTDSEREVGDFVYYCPRLSMVIMTFDWQTEEWAARSGWNMELQEI